MKVKIYHNKNFLNGRKIRLQQEEIHIWCIRWGEIIDFLKEKAYIMDCQEKEKAAQYRFYEDRMRYMAGKICGIGSLWIRHKKKNGEITNESCYNVWWK